MAAQPVAFMANIVNQGNQNIGGNHAGNEENIPPIPSNPSPAPAQPTRRPALAPHNGPLSPVRTPRPLRELEEDIPPALPAWPPVTGPDGTLRRNRIEGNDELVFGSF
ncbi:hypothetical protein OH77DRAFT_1522581 [Trametes cingulata]|nr:hypothetical protein OH77DRAFT_1522581 [Trametes cingulata]